MIRREKFKIMNEEEMLTFVSGLAGIILGHVAWRVIQNKLEAKRDVKFYSFENIKKKSEEENN